MKKTIILKFLFFLILSSCAGVGKSIIESISKPRSVVMHKTPAIIELEGISKYTKFSDIESLKVTKAYINGKGPFNVGILLEGVKLDPEFKTGIILSKTLDKLGEPLRHGKIHHKIEKYRIGDIELQEFVVEVYSPQPAEMNSPVPYLDGVITSGMLEGLKITFNEDFSRMIVSK
jgi:hypothetical protein